MFDDGSEELYGGFWPFIRRFAITFLPIWVFLICYAANINIILCGIIAGLSVSVVPIFENLKLKENSNNSNNGNNVIK